MVKNPKTDFMPPWPGGWCAWGPNCNHGLWPSSVLWFPILPQTETWQWIHVGGGCNALQWWRLKRDMDKKRMMMATPPRMTALTTMTVTSMTIITMTMTSMTTRSMTTITMTMPMMTKNSHQPKLNRWKTTQINNERSRWGRTPRETSKGPTRSWVSWGTASLRRAWSMKPTSRFCSKESSFTKWGWHFSWHLSIMMKLSILSLSGDKYFWTILKYFGLTSLMILGWNLAAYLLFQSLPRHVGGLGVVAGAHDNEDNDSCENDDNGDGNDCIGKPGSVSNKPKRHHDGWCLPQDWRDDRCKSKYSARHNSGQLLALQVLLE